jgi:hypothetical protein
MACRRRIDGVMRLLRAIGSGLAPASRAVGTVMLATIVLVTLPLFVAGVLVDHMMFRP